MVEPLALEGVFAQLDLNKDGKISKEEWMEAWGRIQKQDERRITRVEWGAAGLESDFYDSIPKKHKPSMTRQEWDAGFGTFDKDASGELEAKECAVPAAEFQGYSIADQKARFAKAKRENNTRHLDITSVYDGSGLKGKRVLVTGAKQGLGLEIIKELVKQGAAKAICAARTSSADFDEEATKSPDVVQMITGIDVTKDDTMAKLCAEVGDPVDIVINNAGYFYGPAESVGVGCEGHLNFPQEMLQINVCALGPLRISSALYKAGKLVGGRSKIIIITSQAGSCEWRLTQNPTPARGAQFDGNYGHHMSRASCNIMGVILAQEMRADNIPVQLLHPGFNRTTMTRKYEHIWDIEGAVPAEQGAKRVLYETLKADLSTTGTL